MHFISCPVSEGMSAMIELTGSALSAVRTAMARAATPAEGLRIMVQSGGCAGL